MTHHLTLPVIPTEGETQLQRRFQKLLDDAASEPDLIEARVTEVWRWIATQMKEFPRQEEPLLGEVKGMLGKCVQVAELVSEAAPPNIKPLEEHTEQLQTLVNRVRVEFELQPLSMPLQRLTDVYRQAVLQLKATPAPLTVKAKLYLPGMGHYLISQEVARKLGSTTLLGEKIKGSSSGSNCVAHSHGVFYKQNPVGENVFSPALEAAVVSFHELFGGGSAAPTGCLKLRNVLIKREGIVEKREYVLQAGLGMYGVPLDVLLGLQQWVEVFQSCYGDTKGIEALFDERLEEEVRKDYGAIFKEGRIDIKELLKLLFATIFSHPKDKRLVGFETIDISSPLVQREFEIALNEAGVRAGVWALALVQRYPKVMPGLSLGYILNWYKGREWLNNFMPEDTLEAKVRFAREWQQSLDRDNSALAILSTLLTIPKDGKADNYMVVLPCDMNLKPAPFPKGKVPTLRLVSIDNDISLQAPYKRGGKDTYAQLHSVLLLLKEVMNHPLSEGVRQKLLANSPENWILEWLKHPVNKEREFITSQEEKLLEQNDIDNCGAIADHPYGIDPRTVELMYTLLKRLWNVLRERRNATLNELFGALYPELFAHYQAIEKRGLDPMRSYHLMEKTPLEMVDSKELIFYYANPRPLRESVALLAQTFPWSAQEDRVLCWLELMGKMGLQQATLPKELAQRLLPLAIKSGLSGAVQMLCAHELNPILDTTTQQTIFHLFAHTYINDKLSDEEALVIWKSLFSIKGNQINTRDARDKPLSFTLLDGMVQKPHRGAILLYEGAKQGLDLKVKYNDETLFMRALRLAETSGPFRQIVHLLIPLEVTKETPLPKIQQYLAKTNDTRCQELLLQYEPSVAWHFTLNVLAPTVAPAQESYKAKTPTELRYMTKGMIQRCPQKFQEMVLGCSLSAGNPAEVYGRHLVFPYAEGVHAVHMKVNPEIPGYEYAFQQLASLFFDEELPQHTLFRLELPGWFSRTLPILCSQTVPGENLHALYKKDPLAAHQRLSQLDEDHVSRLIGLTLLGFTEDGKPDNFILNGRRLISVDNDHAFIEAVTYPPCEGIPQAHLNLKSIVFCLDQMKQPLSPLVVTRIKSWNLLERFKSWLEKLHDYHEAIKVQFGTTNDNIRAWSEAPYDQTRIGILFEGRAFINLFDRARRLQKLLSEKPTLTGFELLRELLPTTYPFYEKAFIHTNPVDRFLKGIAEGRYAQANGGHIITQSNPVTFFSLKQLPKGSSYQTPSYCLELLNGIRDEAKNITPIIQEVQKGSITALSCLRIPAHIEKVVNSLTLASLSKDQQIALFTYLADPIKGIAFQKLRILSSPYLTDDHLLSILRRSPTLKQLILSDCPNLTHRSLGELGHLTPNLQLLSLQKLPKLQQLAFYYTPGYLDWGVRPHYQDLSLPFCHRLSLIDCPELTSIRFIVPLLHSLTVTDCPKLETSSLTTSLQQASQLTSLHLQPLPPSLDPLLFILGQQKRYKALIQILERLYPHPLETLSLPILDLTDAFVELLPLLKRLQPKSLHLPATHLTPEGVASLIQASLFPTVTAFDKEASLSKDPAQTLQGHKNSVALCQQHVDGRVSNDSDANSLKASGVTAARPIPLADLQHWRSTLFWAEGDGYLTLLWKTGSEHEQALWGHLLTRFNLEEKECYSETFTEGKLSILSCSRSMRLRSLLTALQVPEGLPTIKTLKVRPLAKKWVKPLVTAFTNLTHLELPPLFSKVVTPLLSPHLLTLTITRAKMDEMISLTTLINNCLHNFISSGSH